MVRNIVQRRPKSLPAGNAKITPMEVSEREELLSGGWKVVARPQESVDVDDRLGGQPRHRGAANVLDRRRQRSKNLSDALPERFELLRPPGVVLFDDDWRGHSNCLRNVASCCCRS